MKNELIKRVLSSLIIIPLVFFCIIKGSYIFNIFVLTILLIALYEWHFLSIKKKYYLPGIIFIIYSFYTFYYFRNENDFKILILILLICISTDIGGYIFGKFFKGPKLTKISPNKTYSGMLGGFILSIIVSSVYLIKIDLFNFGNLYEVNTKMLIIVFLISLVSQIGDLIISLFKRKSKIKNTGNIIPGHGGILDRIDGMIFAFPFAYLLTKIL